MHIWNSFHHVQSYRCTFRPSQGPGVCDCRTSLNSDSIYFKLNAEIIIRRDNLCHHKITMCWCLFFHSPPSKRLSSSRHSARNNIFHATIFRMLRPVHSVTHTDTRRHNYVRCTITQGFGSSTHKKARKKLLPLRAWQYFRSFTAHPTNGEYRITAGQSRAHQQPSSLRGKLCGGKKNLHSTNGQLEWNPSCNRTRMCCCPESLAETAKNHRKSACFVK